MSRTCDYCCENATHIVFADFGDALFLCEDHFKEIVKNTIPSVNYNTAKDKGVA